MKKHGFQRPFNPAQIFVIIIAPLSISIYCAILIPIMDGELLVWTVSTYSPVLITTVCFWALVTGSDPTDYSQKSTKSCSLCEKTVNQDSKHCTKCGRCVLELDHHCKWLNNCIGKANYKKFIVLCTSFLVMSSIEFVTSVMLICDLFSHGESYKRARQRLDIDSELFLQLISVSFAFFALFRFLLMVHLLSFQIYLRCNGLTTYMYIYNKFKKNIRVVAQDPSEEILAHNQLGAYKHSFNFINTTVQED